MLEKLRGVKSLFKKAPEASPSSETIKLSIPRLKNPNLFYWLGLIPMFLLALAIRVRNLPLLQGKYLIELDSYFFFRYAKMLFEQGSVPVMDFMRYVPTGVPTANNLFFPKSLVFFYKIAHAIFPNLSQIEWHIIYPPVITIVSFIFFFLFVKELLNYRTAFIATAFLAVIPAYLQRTGAGFADHEAMAMLWIFISLWLFVLAWKSDNWKKFLPFAAISGIFAGMTAGTWGGYMFLTYGISLFVIAYTIFNPEIRKKHFFQFVVWSVAYLLLGAITRSNFGSDWFANLVNFAPLFAILFLGIHLSVRNKIQNFKIKIPTSLLTFGAALAIGLVGGMLSGAVKLQNIITQLTTQGYDRLFFTVSENAQPYFFGGWWDSFGWIFLLAFAGSMLYFYNLFKTDEASKVKLQWLAAGGYVLFFLAFIFGRFSTSGKHAAIINFFSTTYLYWILGFIFLLFALYLLTYYKGQIQLQNFESKWPLFFLAAWLLITLLAARGQIRLLFATVPPIAIAAGYFVSKITDFAKTQQHKTKYIILAVLVLVSIFAFGVAAQQTALENKYSGSMTPGQWEDAMTWIRTNTTEDAVFAHWWDYGYMTIVLGERAAVTDGGNVMHWNHQSGRYFLTGKDDNSTLTYLKTHNVTHILISEEEIMKYHAFSNIGSDENMDRYSTIGIFGLQQQKEVRNGTMFIYSGGWQLDKDYVLGKLILSAKNAGIGGFSFVVQNDSITEPKAYVVSNSQQFELPISCLIAQGKRINFETTNDSLAGCLMMVPYFDQTGQGNTIGGAFWISEKVWDTNFAKLYLYNETSPYFKEVYADDMPLGIYQGRIVGPIKIWEVEYPQNITADPFYLESSQYG